MTRHHGYRLLALGALIAVAAAGCGSSKPATHTAAPAGSSAPAVADSAAPSDAPSDAPSSSALAGGCRAADMSETVYGGDGTAGAVYSGVALTNKSSKACAVAGFPTLTFVDAKGTAYRFPVAHAKANGAKFSVAPGGKAYFTIKLSGVAPSSGTKEGPCDPPAAGLRISLSSDGAAYVTDKGPWHACGAGEVGPLTPKPDPNLHK